MLFILSLISVVLNTPKVSLRIKAPTLCTSLLFAVTSSFHTVSAFVKPGIVFQDVSVYLTPNPIPEDSKPLERLCFPLNS